MGKQKCEFSLLPDSWRPFESPCQFPQKELPLKHFKGKNYCLFHLPKEYYDQLKIDSHDEYTETCQTFDKELKNLLKLQKETKNLLNLNGVVFPIAIELTSQIFEYQIIFYKAEFLCRVTFDGSSFKQILNCSRAIFHQHVDFCGVNFFSTVFFASTEFHQTVQFSRYGDQKTVFHDRAQFEHSTFLRYLFFDDVKFKGKLSLDGGPSGNKIEHSIENTTFPTITFKSSVFEDNVSFNNRTFLNSTNFSLCQFHKAPTFHNCKLHQDTNFNGAKFHDIKSPHSSRAYRSLRLKLGEMKSRFEEGYFYSLEQKAIQNEAETTFFFKILSKLYLFCSEYGKNTTRPFILMAGLFLSFTFGYYALFMTISPTSPKDPSALFQSFGFSIEQLVSPFRIWRITDTPEWITNFFQIELSSNQLLLLKLTCTFQTIALSTLLALGILAIRWRFKRG